MILALEFLGALAILVPFVLFQTGRWSQHATGYLVANVAGGALLTVVAVIQGQWGFVGLQAVWSCAAAISLVRKRA